MEQYNICLLAAATFISPAGRKHSSEILSINAFREGTLVYYERLPLGHHSLDKGTEKYTNLIEGVVLEVSDSLTTDLPAYTIRLTGQEKSYGEIEHNVEHSRIVSILLHF